MIFVAKEFLTRFGRIYFIHKLIAKTKFNPKKKIIHKQWPIDYNGFVWQFDQIARAT